MNSIESRIYDDAAAAAAEIAPDDVPPLRLDAGPARSRWRRGTSRSRPGRAGTNRPAGTRRWLIPLASAASVVAVIIAAIVTAGTIGHGRGAGRPAARPTATATSPAPAVSRAQATLATEAMDFYFPATGAQYTDGLAFEWTRLKISTRILNSCLAAAGFPQPPFSGSERFYLQAFANNSQFPDLAQRARTDSMTGSPYIAPPPIKAKSAAERRAIQRCTTASGRPFTPIDKIANPLEGTWLGQVSTVQSSALVHALQPGFSACLQTHGIPAAYAQQQITADNPLFDGFFAWMDHLSQAALSTRQQVNEQHRWTPVFVQCARPTVTVVERIQLAKRGTFSQRHERQISAIKALVMKLPSPGDS
jgi:hypothetical protein